MQRVWQLVARRTHTGAEAEAEAAEAAPVCGGLAAPVHEIRGALLAFSLPSSPEEDETPGENEYERVSLVSGAWESRAASPASAAGGRRAGHEWGGGCACVSQAAGAVGGGARADPTRPRAPSIMWGVAMTLLSAMCLGAWYMEEYGNRISHPVEGLRFRLILPLLPVFVIVHLVGLTSSISLYRAYDQSTLPPIRIRPGNEVRPPQRAGAPRRARRLLSDVRPTTQHDVVRTRDSDGSSSATTTSTVPIGLLESALNVSESEAELEQESQGQPGAGPQQPLQPHRLDAASAEGDSGREADVESSLSSYSMSSEPTPASTSILKKWLLSSACTFATYVTGMVLSFISNDVYIGLFLLFATVSGVLPTLDVLAEYFRIPERGELQVRNSEELTSNLTFGQEMTTFAQSTRFSRAPGEIDERSPLLRNN
ncbi:Protein of unknown function [Gryllus bimaculatus]|nr:Protein of unknown function [Gryllus bimaculatus]